MKIGIFGGSFNPPHMGHLQAVQGLARKVGLQKVIVVPSAQNPLKTPTEGPTPEQRLEMTRLAFSDMGEMFEVDDREIRRGGPSYTIDTVKELKKKFESDDLYLIVGADHLDSFDQWKDWQALLGEVNLIVMSRPGWDLPRKITDLPESLAPFVADFDFNFVELKSGKSIQFIKLKDVELSGSELRKWIRIGKKVEAYLPLNVETYIRGQKLYAPLGDRIGDFGVFTQFCSQVLFDRKAIQVKGFDLREVSAPTEFSLVASGTSTRHSSSLAENVMRAVKDEYNVLPQSVEGMDEGRWVLLDYGSLIIHVFYDFVRQEYSIENLWKDARDMGLKDQSPATPASDGDRD